MFTKFSHKKYMQLISNSHFVNFLHVRIHAESPETKQEAINITSCRHMVSTLPRTPNDILWYIRGNSKIVNGFAARFKLCKFSFV